MTQKETLDVHAQLELTPVDSKANSVYARFFDKNSPYWNSTPQYNKMFLKCQENYANDLLRRRGHVLLNEVYDTLGLDQNPAGAVVGWVMNGDGDNRIVFEIQTSTNDGCMLLDFNVDGVIFDKIGRT